MSLIPDGKNTYSNLPKTTQTKVESSYPKLPQTPAQKTPQNIEPSIFNATKPELPADALPDSGKVPAKDVPLSEEELLTEAFKIYDKNKDLYVTEQEFIDHILTDYMTNGKQVPEGMNISDYITQITDKFRRNAGSDEKANIDEFKNLYAPESHVQGEEHNDVYPPMP